MNTIDSEVDEILQGLADDYLEAVHDLTRVGPRNTANVYLDGAVVRASIKKAKTGILNLIAQEANKARVSELKMLQDLYKNELKFTHRDESELRSYTQHRIAQLTADKEQAGE